MKISSAQLRLLYRASAEWAQIPHHDSRPMAALKARGLIEADGPTWRITLDGLDVLVEDINRRLRALEAQRQDLKAQRQKWLWAVESVADFLRSKGREVPAWAETGGRKAPIELQ